jgi:hypothetical protein
MYTAVLCLSHPYTSFLHLRQPCFEFFFLDIVQFMQAILTKHAFESSTTDGITSLLGHNKIPALPSHSVQVLLTAQTLVSALKNSDKYRQAISRFARWAAAEQALTKQLQEGPNAEVCLINADCSLATHQEYHWNAHSKPINALNMAWKSFSNSLLRAMRTEGAPYSQGDGEVAYSIFQGGLHGPAQGCVTKARSSQIWGEQRYHAPPAGRSHCRYDCQEMGTFGEDLAVKRDAHQPVPATEPKLHAPGSCSARSNNSSKRMAYNTAIKRKSVLWTQKFNSGGEASLHDLKPDSRAGDPSFWSTYCDSFDGNKDGIEVALPNLHEHTSTTGPSLTCLCPDESDVGMDIPDCTTCKEPAETNDMEHLPTFQSRLRRQHQRFSLESHTWNRKGRNDILMEQVAREAMLSFGMLAIQVQWLCMTLATYRGMAFAILPGNVLEMGHAFVC